MAKLKVAMIGLGMAAGHHARALLDLSDRIECVAAYSQTAARREAFVTQYSIPISGDLVDAVRDGRPLRAAGDDALRAHRFIEAILSASR